ncbi:MAG TPA: DUF4226 domain-containing protein, partial [Mycobacterium sp.]|nr:DUF4226 domain-containing protein [Mycobacterium sp.]
NPPLSPPPGVGTEQQGVAARVMKNMEAALSQQQSATAEFDRQVIEALLHAHKTTVAGRRLLDDLESQIETAARTWDLSTTTGAREFQRFLIAKLGQIVKVVEEANDDDTSKQALAAAWAALYMSQAGQDGTARDDHAATSGRAEPDPEPYPDAGGDPYFDTLPADESPPGSAGAARYSAEATPTTPYMRAAPGSGGEMPGIPPMSPAGVPAGLPLGGLLQTPREPAYVDDDAVMPGDLTAADDAASEGTGAEGIGNDAPAAPGSPVATDPTSVTLPDGQTVTAATPQLAAAMQAAVSGTPIADAFRRQGIAIPPPGTPITGPVDQSRVSPGDIGMFTDRHALALGSGKALLDGQIQRIGNVSGPSFLGWQHPPTLETTTPDRTPTPTRPSAAVNA